jgi:signal transduction histidine kinase
MRIKATTSVILLLAFVCSAQTRRPTIEFTYVPLTNPGGQFTFGTINGRVSGAQPDQQIVLYARSGNWYVQPYVENPFTTIQADSTWSNSTHLGTEYAALLVQPGYRPPFVVETLPQPGGDIVAIAVVPASPFFWQTWWFRGLMFLAFAFIGFLFYRRRQQRLIIEMNARFEQRLAERNRIAQDLHDTLLQGLLSASMQLHVADNLLETDAPAKALVGRVLTLMGQVVEEGRNAVRGLRSPTVPQELDAAFLLVQQEFTFEKPVDFRIVVEGTPRQLYAAIRDEVYRVGREALVNAFRHSKADKIEVVLEYAPKYFRVTVRDNGLGMEAVVIKDGRENHWGLSGMRERADEIGGNLRVLSRAGAGTEIELTIPGHIAYEHEPTTSVLQKLDPRRLFQRRGTDGKDQSI